MYKILRTFLFFFDPEWVHYFSMNGLKLLCRLGCKPFIVAAFKPKGDHQSEHFNLLFPNKVGLGAGFDKNARHLNELEALGFGFVEIGTVTPLPQAGNEKPRLFRLPKDKALINRMGFNNDGVEEIVERLKSWKEKKTGVKGYGLREESYGLRVTGYGLKIENNQLPQDNFENNSQNPKSETENRKLKTENRKHETETRKPKTGILIIGGNIGKNKITPNEEAWKDYKVCFEALHDYVHYFVVNVSSPNTPGLRALQEKDALLKILSNLQAINKMKQYPKPILLKIAPDLTKEQIDDVIDLAMEIKLDGLVAANTTISREGLVSPANIIGEAGGLSGAPLQKRSTEIVAYIHQKTNGKIPVIASGGIFTATDAKEKLDAGASLIQVWTGFIYEGPSIVKKICEGI